MIDSMDRMKKLFEDAGIIGSACDFLTMLWGTIQFFDDVFDGDPVKEFDKVLYSCLLSIPLNKFYQDNMAALAPQIHVAIEKWHMANELEGVRRGDARSFMWRAAFWDVAAVVCSITGNQNIRGIIAAYDESFEEYLKEVNDAKCR